MSSQASVVDEEVSAAEVDQGAEGEAEDSVS